MVVVERGIKVAIRSFRPSALKIARVNALKNVVIDKILSASEILASDVARVSRVVQETQLVIVSSSCRDENVKNAALRQHRMSYLKNKPR
jgi:hypothetical protein